MVIISVQGNLRMRKRNTNKAVPLDAVPERRTERCSPRFRSGDRFLGEPRFRYLSPGREGEKCRPLDHVRQIPFIHSARIICSGNFYIYRTVFKIFPPFGTIKCVLIHCTFGNRACTLNESVISKFTAIIKVLLCSIRYVLVRTGTK